MWAALGCRGGRRWSGWAALLIGGASGPQAAASVFHAPYTIPDTGTAVLGVLLAWLCWPPSARTARPATTPKPSAHPTGEPPDDPTQPGRRGPGRRSPSCRGPPLPPNPRGRPAARRGAALIVINPGIVAGIESILRPLRDLGMRPAGGHRRGSVACTASRSSGSRCGGLAPCGQAVLASGRADPAAVRSQPVEPATSPIHVSSKWRDPASASRRVAPAGGAATEDANDLAVSA